MKHRRKNQFWVYLLVLLLVLIGRPFTAYSEVPQQINYQGYLTNDVGSPVEGDVQMVFSIYDVPTAGTALWWEEQTMLVINGIYNVQIGRIRSATRFRAICLTVSAGWG